jgi:ligand-binding sensor domain-containing protein
MQSNAFRLILFLNILFGSCNQLLSQNFSFINFTNNDGLPQSQVQAIAQDNEGFLWIGTLGGLTRFNGIRFNSNSSSKLLPSNRVSSIFCHEKYMYLGFQGGIVVQKGANHKTFFLPKKFKTANVNQFSLYKSIVYVATDEGLFQFKNGIFKEILLPNEEARTVRSIVLFKNHIYLGTSDGLYIVKNNSAFKVVNFGSKSISKLHLGKKKLLIATFSEGVFYSEKMTQFNEIPYKTKSAFVNDVIEYEKNNYLIACDLGLIQVSNNRSTLISEEKGLPMGGLNVLFEDDENNIWIGTDGKGLVKIGDRNVVYFNRKTGLDSDLALCIEPFKNKFFFGSYDKGLFEIDFNGNCKKLPLNASSVWQITSFRNRWYFGTSKGLFESSDGINFKQIPIDLNFSSVRVVEKTTSNLLLICSEETIQFIDKAGRIVEVNGFNKIKDQVGLVRDAIYYDGEIWLGTTEGLFSIDPKSGTALKRKKFNSFVSSLALDQNNCLWIGTESGCFKYHGIAFEELNFSMNSASRFINFINFHNNYAYLGTNDGLYVLLNDSEKDKPMVVNHLGIYNGLSHLESNINASLIFNNYLWFGTADALNRLDINAMSEINKYIPRIKIRDVVVNYMSIDWKGFGNSEQKSLSLAYNKNNLSVQLDAIYLKEPKTLKFRYYMEGLDNSWSLWDESQNIQFSNLPSGEYILHVRAKSESGSSSNELKFFLKIRTPFWKRWWFFALCGVFIYLMIRFYLKLQIKRERDKNDRERLLNQSKLLSLEQKSLNASMNRHFIFNALNSIQYFIMTQDKLSATRYLSSFAKLIRKNLDSASEQNTMVSLSEEIERLELYLSLEAMRFKDRFNYTIQLNNIEIEHVEVPAMLLQPFVENSIIHGILPNEEKVGEILIEVKLIENQLEIRIDDNGVGIKISKEKKNKIAGDHTSRGMEITLNRIDLIKTILNKDFQLIGPFQMEDENHSIKGTRVLIKIPYESLED